ncbi:hypothetical protein Pmani_038507, partial [Petrolisthes manimaculis]
VDGDDDDEGQRMEDVLTRLVHLSQNPSLWRLVHSVIGEVDSSHYTTDVSVSQSNFHHHTDPKTISLKTRTGINIEDKKMASTVLPQFTFRRVYIPSAHTRHTQHRPVLALSAASMIKTKTPPGHKHEKYVTKAALNGQTSPKQSSRIILAKELLDKYDSLLNPQTISPKHWKISRTL